MMMPRDIAGVSVGAASAQLRDRLQKLRALDGMGLHDLIFLRRQPAGLVQDGVRDGDLAHIVHDRGKRDILDLLLGKALAHVRIPEKILRDIMNPPHMLSRLPVPEFNGGGERLDHSLVQLHDPARLFQKLPMLQLHHAA